MCPNRLLILCTARVEHKACHFAISRVKIFATPFLPLGCRVFDAHAEYTLRVSALEEPAIAGRLRLRFTGMTFRSRISNFHGD